MYEFPRLRGAHRQHVTDPPPLPFLLLSLSPPSLSTLLPPPTPPHPCPPPPSSGAVADRPVGRDSSNLLYGTSSPLAPAMCSQCAAGKCRRSPPCVSLITNLLPSVRKGAETVCVLVVRFQRMMVPGGESLRSEEAPRQEKIGEGWFCPKRLCCLFTFTGTM